MLPVPYPISVIPSPNGRASDGLLYWRRWASRKHRQLGPEKVLERMGPPHPARTESQDQKGLCSSVTILHCHELTLVLSPKRLQLSDRVGARGSHERKQPYIYICDEIVTVCDSGQPACTFREWGPEQVHPLPTGRLQRTTSQRHQAQIPLASNPGRCQARMQLTSTSVWQMAAHLVPDPIGSNSRSPVSAVNLPASSTTSHLASLRT